MLKRSMEQQASPRKIDALPSDHLLANRYRIAEVLGSGGFGITYSAWDNLAGIQVAVKELFPHTLVTRKPGSSGVLVNEDHRETFSHMYSRFREEAMQLKQLQTIPGVVKIFDLFSENQTIYYVMEYLEGQDLKKKMKQQGTMTWEQLNPILRSLLKTLQHLHSHQLIHRDISPDNIYLTRIGEVKLIDFGSVRTYHDNRQFTVYVKKSFAPIEQYQSDGRQGPWTDVYSLCVTIYYVLTGVLPPGAPDRILPGELDERTPKPVIPLDQLCPHLPAEVTTAVRAGMELMPQDRIQSITALSQLLFPGEPEIQHHISSPVPSHTPPHIPAHPPAPPAHPVQHQKQTVLICSAGRRLGHRWVIYPGSMLSIGRDPRCHVVYPADTAGVSRHQCSFYLDVRGGVLVRDDGSSNGTWLEGKHLEPGRWYPAQRGMRIRFAHEEFIIQ